MSIQKLQRQTKHIKLLSLGKMCPLLNTKDLHRIFKELDKNGDGLVSVVELDWLLQNIGAHLSTQELESSIGKSSLNFEEFLSFYDSIIITRNYHHDQNYVEADEPIAEETEESDLWEAFKVFDMNGDGFISSEEVQSVLSKLGLWGDGKDCRKMMHVYDKNFDGVLDFEEFKNMMMLNTTCA